MATVSNLQEFRNARDKEISSSKPRAFFKTLGSKGMDALHTIHRHPREFVMTVGGITLASGLVMATAERAPLEEYRSPDELFDNEIKTAIATGPDSPDQIVGTFKVGNRTVSYALPTEIGKRGFPVGGSTQERVTTVSANEIGNVYQPSDKIELFEVDVNKDGTPEIAAKRVS